MEARETEAGITQESCVLKEAHGFSRREYHTFIFHDCISMSMFCEYWLHLYGR